MSKMKEFLRRLLLKTKFFHSTMESIRIYYLLKRTKNNIKADENRHLRVRVLRHGLAQLAEAMRLVNYRHGLLLVNGEEYVLAEGVLLNLKGTSRYLKVSDGASGNEGKEIFDFLKSKNIEVNNMIDLGANYGEISLYFSKMRPAAKILAIEASPDNFKIFQSNCGMQNFSTSNIILVNEAVSDKKGFVEITAGISPENMLVNLKEKSDKEAKIETVTVAADTLTSFMKRYDINKLDLLKVDIEGAEPLLYDSLRQCVSSIKSVLLEIGSRVDHKKYLPLVSLLWDFSKERYDRGSGKKYETLVELQQDILSCPAFDLWFINI